MSDAGFTAKPLGSGIGREVSGLDIEGDIAPATSDALCQLWLEHGLVVFPEIGTSPEAQLRLSRCFGELEVHPIPLFRHPQHDELILLTNKDGANGPVYDFGGVPTFGRISWHSDLAYTTTPNAGALLRMVQKPAEGGQTGWIDCGMAYDALPDQTKQRIGALETVSVFRAGLEEMRFSRPDGKRLDQRKPAYPHFAPVARPLVSRHPQNGRRVINLSALNVEAVLGLPRAEGDGLIRELLAHLENPAFRYFHNWQQDDMVLWDNRRMLHCTLGHPADQVRIVHRTTIRGDAALGRLATETELETVA